MTWWNRKPKKVSDPIDLSALEALASLSQPHSGGSFVNTLEEATAMTQHQSNEVPLAETPPDPAPDLSTKPKNIVGYCFGYVCPKKHVNSTFENITVDGYKERRACQACGAVSKPAVVKRTAEAQWGNKAQPSNLGDPKPNWGWYNSYTHYFGKTLDWGDPLWTEYEFVHYLDTPKKTKKR